MQIYAILLKITNIIRKNMLKTDLQFGIIVARADLNSSALTTACSCFGNRKKSVTSAEALCFQGR